MNFHEQIHLQRPESLLRSPEQVMRLARMGSFYPTRLSFMRSLLRRLAHNKATPGRTLWDMNAQGYGRAVITLLLGGTPYSLVAFASPLAENERTDRVIALAWDSTFVLYDGIPESADLDSLQFHVSRQEAGRFDSRVLVLSRANKSVRLFNHVVERLAAGEQPELSLVQSIGYLMRTTAVYGNGKFGIADRDQIVERPGMTGPFQIEMLTVWLIRHFTHELVEHVARHLSPDSCVPLKRSIRRFLGVGNSTGLGMAPFLVSHPVLLNNWILARETALARVRAIDKPDTAEVNRVLALLNRAQRHVLQWNVDDSVQMRRIVCLREELQAVELLMSDTWLSESYPWDRLIRQSADWSLECQELLVSLLLEPYGAVIDDLTDSMKANTRPQLQQSMSVSELQRIVNDQFNWALEFDFTAASSSRQFWYVSEEKLEPRIGDRYAEPGAERELPLDIARRVQQLQRQLLVAPDDQSVAEFLMHHPEHRYIVRRVQSAGDYPYGEIHENLIDESCLPIDMLRCKLSFFGASKFDPRSSRWTRITLYQGAPLADEINPINADDWWLPVLDHTGFEPAA